MMVFLIQDITNCSGAQEPQILPMVFSSEEAALLYAKHFGTSAWKVKRLMPTGLSIVKLLTETLKPNKKAVA